MSMLLYILAFVAGGLGVSLVAMAASAVQEVVGMIAILIAAVLVVGAAIVDAVNAMAKRLPEPAETEAKADADDAGSG